MFAKQTIRKKLLIAMLVLTVAVIVLAYSGFRGVYAYRNLATTVSNRAAELPTTAELTHAVDELRYSFRGIHVKPLITDEFEATKTGPQSTLMPGVHLEDSSLESSIRVGSKPTWSDFRFREALLHVIRILSRYQKQLQSSDLDDVLFLADRTKEQEMVNEMTRLLDDISAKNSVSEMADPFSALVQTQRINEQLNEIHRLAYKLPTFLQERMARFRLEVRSQYRIWIILSIGSTTFAVTLLAGVLVYARRSVINPFKELLNGARRVANGEFQHRIEMHSQDELAELASAINMATAEFFKIQRDLNDQVRDRSREVIRNEQLASVGFLAAGVAHEINNPLASIAWSAEALESRLHRILHPTDTESSEPPAVPDLDTLRNYLRRIQEEAFRCKGITERLLDFSRLGQAERKQSIDISELIEDVIEMVRHLGQYRSRKISFTSSPDAFAWASPQEMKQVVLNLLTNALDSLGPDQSDGTVQIEVSVDTVWLRLAIEDNGCGMTDEVLEHLFEPFFTRRRDGRGTGLGLPITSRIIADHGGRIQPSSQGLNLGSRFEILIPRKQAIHENAYQYQNADAA
ncbi:MAG: HAMP domain-containing sensor histidine kinase [Pirellulaceae bacterium]|nr:HAMP domain-containing sensor histidine kinase [Pirellulaceae bacterium]